MKIIPASQCRNITVPRGEREGGRKGRRWWSERRRRRTRGRGRAGGKGNMKRSRLRGKEMHAYRMCRG